MEWYELKDLLGRIDRWMQRALSNTDLDYIGEIRVIEDRNLGGPMSSKKYRYTIRVCDEPKITVHVETKHHEAFAPEVR